MKHNDIERSNDMTKTEFNNLKDECPWFMRLKNEPHCRAARDVLSHKVLHCAKKNCAVLYWLIATSGNLEGSD